MEESTNNENSEKKFLNIKTVSIPFSLEEIKENISITTNSSNTTSKKQIISQALWFHSQGKIKEAIKCYQYCINQGFKDPKVFSNYGMILRNLRRFKEAEILYRKAIKLNPNFANAHSNLGNILKDLGKLKEAELCQRKAIEINPNFANAFSNLGIILRDLDKLREAELCQRKAIQLNPKFADPHSNLGTIFIDLGKLEEAEISYRKAIKLNPNLADAHLNLGSLFIDLGKLHEGKSCQLKAIELNPHLAKAYYSLSRLKLQEDDKIWKDKLFSENILKNTLPKEKIDIFFARANIYHKEKNYAKSAKYLKLANKLKLSLNPSKPDLLINKSRLLLIESKKSKINKSEKPKSPESIFIVGMPRSGSTLLESILSMNNNVDDLGEMNILEEAYLDKKNIAQNLSISNLYWAKIKKLKNKATIITDKKLDNYQYTGIISSQIRNAKIIHCFRNPLDNILSIYRAHFTHGNEYASSLADCTRIYLDHEEVMTEYKNTFRSKIYDLNYDLLVENSNKEIKSLISWLGWQWDDSYLTPHLNPRSVSTASSIQVRSPINSQSVDGWKNYKTMLKPTIDMLIKVDRYRNLIS